MPEVTVADVRAAIASGETAPVYVVVGPDGLENAELAAGFAESVDEGLRAFNVERLRGGEASVATLIDAARTLPMMVPRRVVLVFDAERMFYPKEPSAAREAAKQHADTDLADLAAFIEGPPAHATVVFVCTSLDGRRTITKKLKEHARIVACGVIADAADAEQWVQARVAREGLAIEPRAARLVVERAGSDLVRLRASVDRLTLYAAGQASITVDDVRQIVPPGPEAQTDFGVAKAIWRNDARDALRELGLALDAGAAPFMVLGQLRAAAEKAPPARLKAAMAAVLRTDLALKSSGGDARTLLERLTVELCGDAGSPPRHPGGGYGRR